MPLSVVAANPTVVMPYSLATAFQRSQAWQVVQNIYPSREVQRTALVATSRKSWAQTKLLTAGGLGALRTFYLAQGLQEFWFYDLWETVPAQSAAGYDLTGSVTAGRYTVRFDGTWTVTYQMGRCQAGISLIEVS